MKHIDPALLQALVEAGDIDLGVITTDTHRITCQLYAGQAIWNIESLS